MYLVYKYVESQGVIVQKFPNDGKHSYLEGQSRKRDSIKVELAAHDR